MDFLQGIWWNPAKKGEGFIFAGGLDPETNEERAIGYYFTHNGTTAIWLLLNLVAEGSGVYSGPVIDVIATGGSRPGEIEIEEEDEIGQCTITTNPDGSMNISVTMGSNSVDYQIGALFGAGEQYEWPTDPPVDPPEPPPEPAGNPFDNVISVATRVFRGQDYGQPVSVFPPYLGPDPIWSTVQLRRSVLSAGTNRMASFRIMALDGDITGLRFSKGGPNNPQWKNEQGGAMPSVIEQGALIDVSCLLDQNPSDPGVDEDSFYLLDSDQGRIITLTEHIMSG